MSGDDTHAQASPFAAIRHEDADGVEYWSVRELAKLLGYRRWEAFPRACYELQGKWIN